MVLIIILLVGAGCIAQEGSSSPFRAGAAPDPESGIVHWIDAVNSRNYGSVYDLMPREKRAGISRNEYILLNRENPSPFLTSGAVIHDYFVLEKRVDGLNATVTAGLQTRSPSMEEHAAEKGNTVFFTFDLTFEDNEWKAWVR